MSKKFEPMRDFDADAVVEDLTNNGRVAVAVSRGIDRVDVCRMLLKACEDADVPKEHREFKAHCLYAYSGEAVTVWVDGEGEWWAKYAASVFDRTYLYPGKARFSQEDLDRLSIRTRGDRLGF